MRYPWYGNVREMENTIERIVLMGDENGISATDMLLLLPALKNENLVDEYNAIPMENKTLDELECEAVTKALKQCDNNQSKAAKMLGITVRQIGYKVKKYGL
jgi:Nif-specific regulatory protein